MHACGFLGGGRLRRYLGPVRMRLDAFRSRRFNAQREPAAPAAPADPVRRGADQVVADEERAQLLAEAVAGGACAPGVMIGIGAMAPISTEVPVTSALTLPISVPVCMSQTEAT